MSDRTDRWRATAQSAVERVRDTRSVRAVSWYVARRGNQLSGGIAYSALFSLVAGLTIGFSVFAAALSNRPELREAMVDQIDDALPGLIRTEDSSGLRDPTDLTVTTAFNVTTVVAALVLLWTAISVMTALRLSVRAMFDAPVVGVNPVMSKVWALVGFALLGALLVISAAVSVASQVVTRYLNDWLDEWSAIPSLVSVGAGVVAVLLDAVLIYLVVRVVARCRPRRMRDLVLGSLAAGTVTFGLRWAGTSLVTGAAERNALLASAAAVATVLLLVNFVARVLLLVCAWMHDPPRLDEIARAEDEVAQMRHRQELERYVHAGRGEGRVYSPVLRGIRRGRLG